MIAHTEMGNSTQSIQLSLELHHSKVYSYYTLVTSDPQTLHFRPLDFTYSTNKDELTMTIGENPQVIQPELS